MLNAELRGAGLGVRYLFIGKALEQRATYRVLGVLLFMQLGLSAGSTAVAQLVQSFTATNAPAPSATAGSQQPSPGQKQARQHAVVLEVCRPAAGSLFLGGVPEFFRNPDTLTVSHRLTAVKQLCQPRRSQLRAPVRLRRIGGAPYALARVQTPLRLPADMSFVGYA